MAGSKVTWKSPPFVAGSAVVVMLTSIGLCSGYPCVPTGLRYGIWADRCPASDLRLSAEVSASNLVRDRWRSVRVDASALWVEPSIYGRLDHSHRLSRSLALNFALLDPQGNEVPGLKHRNLSWSGGTGNLQVKVPDVADGDYRLRTTVDAGFESVDVDVELPFYRPALVHLMSDRPLYKPGQEVLLRSAVLRKRDSKPIGRRPGKWRIVDPSGLEMMLEKVPTDEFGVSATTFPLDSEAEVGSWTATYTTGADSDQVTFQVKPFELPRFTVDLDPNQKWYAVDDRITVDGTARYTSGAPVSNASVEVVVRSAGGRWPIPLSWEEPILAKTAADGRFTFDLGEVPADLLDVAKISVRAVVTDEAKETVSGLSVLTLSEQSLAVMAVTELRDGLVEKFNNRAYVRVTTPDGRPLRKASLRLSNPYDTTAPVMEAQTDEDGVAAIQVDPGAPVTIVVPPAPVRQRPLRPDAPRLAVALRLPSSSGLSLAERRAFDRLHPAIARCGTLTVGTQQVNVGISVRPDGSVSSATGGDDALSRCVIAATSRALLPRADRRSYKLGWLVPDSLQPSIQHTSVEAFGNGKQASAAFERGGLQARKCLTLNQGREGSLFEIHWTQAKGSTRLGMEVHTLNSSGLSPVTRSCVLSALKNVGLHEPAKEAALGVSTFRLSVPVAPGQQRLQATTTTGFQFAVEASSAGKTLGEGKLTLGVGSIPNVRLRATPTLAVPGQTVEIEVLRGPNFRQELPEKIHLRKGGRFVAKAVLDPKTRRATLTIPPDVHGFLEVEVLGGRAVIYARPTNALSIVISTDNDTYRPGDTAKLTLQTRAGDAGVQATVSLAGVDQTLSQLAPLLAPDDWGRVTVRTKGQEAFGTFGPRALQLGQIRGENAAKAVVLLVNHLPGDASEDPGVSGSGSVRPNETEVLTANFYRALEALVGKVRAWERSAPKGQQITPEATSGWWSEVLSDAKKPVVDAFGLPLSLRSLPSDLQNQTAPHQLVADSTRLSEDIENWSAWIEENAP